ncbi:MAG TPA: response regulator [Candidatus Lachnoclostridium pullistercoris]|uniref:Stage 0 sporulation protein A homolog n=1 Tax=Candidatus Lachnoclostridium pullistercoris TaxID=2838632 RepID=A0A9D2PBM3_9FIRM|nr:response regulator [Candidatus Lachnoclostridium pullistercoris]
MYKVMIVEDDPTVRRGLCGTIRWEELRCQLAGEAGNGEEGLELALKISPDIVITDVKMPKMDGVEMIRQLRRHGCQAKMIILTAYGDFGYAQSAIRLGVSDYLLKPLKDGAIEEAVLAITRKGQPAADPVLFDFDPEKHFKGKYVEEALDFIRSRYREDINIGMVASYLDLSEGYLSRILKRETGYSFTEYLTNYRISRAMEYLKDCRLKVYEAAELAGYQDTAYFSSQFKKVVGMSPSEYQNRCR